MSMISSSEKGEVTEKLMATIKRWQPIQYSDLLRRCHRYVSGRELQEQLETLLGGGMVKEKVEGNKRFYIIGR